MGMGIKEGGNGGGAVDGWDEVGVGGNGVCLPPTFHVKRSTHFCFSLLLYGVFVRIPFVGLQGG